jgi:hypothetical protein
LIIGAGVGAQAHRRDEYLQAARIAVDPDVVRIELDLTAGIAVADTVIADIDRDASGDISPEEALAHAGVVRQAIGLEIDGTPIETTLAASRYPSIAAIRSGEGPIRLELVGHLPELSSGTHHLRYRNAHRADIGVYLVNALVPSSNRVAIGGQRRDIAQRDLTIDYVLGAERRAMSIRVLVVGGAVLAIATLWWFRRRTGASR